MLHCHKCDALFEAHEDARADIACPRCGCIVRASAAIQSGREDSAPGGAARHDEVAHFLLADDSRRRGFSLSGGPHILRWTKNVAVRLVSSVCPGCGHKVGRGMFSCPQCGRALKKKGAPAPQDFRRVLRKMLVAATVFIGLPAAVIVFVLVVCAPEGDDVGANAQRPAPFGRVAQRSPAPSTVTQQANTEQSVPHRSPRSVLRSIRAWLRGAEHGGSSVPAKTPLEQTGEGVNDAHVPQVGTRNGEQVKPDATR
jgi:predicted RNA-binding Zn-ribbon protein involved in translation (DUF1610 family)